MITKYKKIIMGGILFLMACLAIFLISYLKGALPDTAVLLRAIATGELGKVEAALKAGARLQERDFDGDNCLHLACQTADTQRGADILWVLLDNGANPRIMNNAREQPHHHILFISDQVKRMQYLRDLIVHGAEIDQRDINGQTILDKTVQQRDVFGCEVLMRWWGALFAQDSIEQGKATAGRRSGEGLGFTDAYDAINKKVVRPGGKNVDEYDNYSGLTPLMLATLKGDKAWAIDLIAKRANINAVSRDRWEYTALELAIMQQNVLMVELLLERGARVAVPNKRGQTALFAVLRIDNQTQQLKIAQLLIQKGVDLNVQDAWQRRTVLQKAIQQGQHALVNLLTTQYGNKLNVGLRDKSGLSAAEIARTQGQQNVITELNKTLKGPEKK